jgi:hypothetical protein
MSYLIRPGASEGFEMRKRGVGREVFPIYFLNFPEACQTREMRGKVRIPGSPEQDSRDGTVGAYPFSFYI